MKFFHEINHTVNLPRAYNGVDSWIEDVAPWEGTKGLRNLILPALNNVSGFNKYPHGYVQTPASGCARFIDGLNMAHGAYLRKDGKRVTDASYHTTIDMSGVPETEAREYARLNMWVYKQLTVLVPTEIKGVGVREVTELNPQFVKHCAQEELGADDQFENLEQLFLDWQAKLLAR